MRNSNWSELNVPSERGSRKGGLNLKRPVCLAKEFELYHIGNGENQRKF